jgi:L-alanine-DL-glutamate epimerase-like enolase superfamily enzyme
VREKLKAPFGFKGGYLSELWQVVCRIQSQNAVGVGVGVQSVLWSDEKVFSLVSEEEGNLLMYQITQKALELITGKTGKTPIEIIDGVFNELLEYAKTISPTGEKLRHTFVRNALVAVDNALWQVYSKEKGEANLDKLVPNEFSDCLSQRQNLLCNVPLISYGVSENDIKNLLDNGAVLLKIKIGFDDGGKKSKAEMVEWDKNRLKAIHEIAKNYSTPYTKTQKILYYLDANGKYDNVERVKQLLDYAKEIGALDKIVLFEEPFEECNHLNVSALPVRFAVDESVHSELDVDERLNLGYKAITLKPIAKTLSETLKILKRAKQKNAVCFCADLTVNPLLVEWNKNVASRIATLPEMNIGILESNGEQNYTNWKVMENYLSKEFVESAKPSRSIYNISQKFFELSGGIFEIPKHYNSLFK